MTDKFQALVAGAGPAGMAAAMELARCGVRTAIVDQAPSPGGQVYRQLPAEFSVAEAAPNPRKRVGRMLLERYGRASSSLSVFQGAEIWGSFEPHRLNLRQGRELNELEYERLIICEGARERMVPFPGWTLPGVLTLGGLQKMVANQGLLPGKRILLGGSGPLSLAVGATVVRAGGRIAGLCEAAGLGDQLPMLPELFRQKGLWRETWFYLSALLKGRVPIKRGWAIRSVQGDDRVRRATLCRVDRDWKPVAGSERTLDVDAVAVGFGFQAQCRLTRLVGCGHGYDSDSRSFKPLVDEFQRTDQPGVYAAGDGAGIGGATMAEIQGRLAGLHAALSLGRISRSDYDRRATPWATSRDRVQGYVDRLNRIFTPRDGIYGLMDDDTIVCRCEGVTAGCINEHIDRGRRSLVQLKPSRLAMGPCQGRVCESIAVEMLRLKGVSPDNIEPLGLRPPLSPIPLAVFEEYARTGSD